VYAEERAEVGAQGRLDASALGLAAGRGPGAGAGGAAAGGGGGGHVGDGDAACERSATGAPTSAGGRRYGDEPAGFAGNGSNGLPEGHAPAGAPPPRPFSLPY
jgi:hypothetical protein